MKTVQTRLLHLWTQAQVLIFRLFIVVFFYEIVIVWGRRQKR